MNWKIRNFTFIKDKNEQSEYQVTIIYVITMNVIKIITIIWNCFSQPDNLSLKWNESTNTKNIKKI